MAAFAQNAEATTTQDYFSYLNRSGANSPR
jgi:hypothetical protein